MTTHSSDSTFPDFLLAAFSLTAVWALAAAIRPTATYHLAPILIAGVAPVLRRSRAGSAAVAAVVGASIAATATLVLAALDLLQGPSLLPRGGALMESLVFATLGAVGGWLIAATTGRVAAR
ncbi:MAG: hypothetical protein QNJ77_05840 [Acidimicrobiia bacterium]|nr:hypothetical protein [Acidimicrobiia bacterium]